LLTSQLNETKQENSDLLSHNETILQQIAEVEAKLIEQVPKFVCAVSNSFVYLHVAKRFERRTFISKIAMFLLKFCVKVRIFEHVLRSRVEQQHDEDARL